MTAHWPHEYHPKNNQKTARQGVKLGPQHQQLISPADKNFRSYSDNGIKPGAISFLPARQIKLVSETAEMRKSPTTEWGSPIGVLSRGEEVKGCVLGEWIRLISWEAASGRPLPTKNSETEVWVFS